MRLECGHDAELQLADPVLAVTENVLSLPKVGDERPARTVETLRSNF